jgi:class 3 adenylate cyclase/pimeloyl-ACP methyl ester carboxylesterase
MQQQVQFVTSPDGISLAVATVGSGTPLLIIPGWISNVEREWDLPPARDLFERLAENHLLIRYDKRGTGLSDRQVTDYSPEANLRDLEQIIADLGLLKVALLGYSQGGPIAAAYAVKHPEQVSHLIFYGSYHDGTTAYFQDLIDGFVALIRADWGGYGSTAMVEMFAPGAPPAIRKYFAEFEQDAATAEGAEATLKSFFEFRVTDILPEIRTPTLVLHRRGDKTCPFEQGREIAAKIPGARFVPLEGDMHPMPLGDIEPIISAITEFLGGAEGARTSARTQAGLVTILITDIGSSTALTQRLGDAGAQEMVRDHNEIVRYYLNSTGGTEIKHLGDGIMASFPSAVRAIGCAIGIQESIAERNREKHGDELGVRIGLNAGEPVAEEDDLFGTAVQLASRICDAAELGQVLASDVVRQLAAGKGFEFDDEGRVPLKGFREPVPLFSVRDAEVPGGGTSG